MQKRVYNAVKRTIDDVKKMINLAASNSVLAESIRLDKIPPVSVYVPATGSKRTRYWLQK